MITSYSTPIWFYPLPIDFRRQIDGLVILIADQLELNPTSGQLFLFRNKRANKIKMLWWDRNGFCLLYKRLEKGKLLFPRPSEIAMEITRDELSWLLSGLNFLEHKPLPDIKASSFY